jgi:CIC family chloride channel protein
MISNTVAYLISRQYQKTSLFDLLARQDGMILPSVEEQRERVLLRVEDAMPEVDGAAARPEEMFAAAVRRAGLPPDHCFLAGGPAGWRVYRRLTGSDEAGAGAGNASEASPFLYLDLSLEDALQIMGDWPVLPVISRLDPQTLEGVLAHADILKTYREVGSIDPA